jgi:hypothetical protein
MNFSHNSMQQVLKALLHAGHFRGHGTSKFGAHASYRTCILLPPPPSHNYSSEVGLYGPVVSVPGYRSEGPVFDSRRYQIF